MNRAHNTTKLKPLRLTSFILTSTLSGALFAEETVRPNVVVIIAGIGMYDYRRVVLEVI